MSAFSNFVRGFNEDRFWKYYRNKSGGVKKYLFTLLYMRMATKQCGYVGRETIFLGKPHFSHGFHGVHISRYAEIGDSVTIFQGVTIGQSGTGAPKIGNNVVIGANATIVGGIEIGDNAQIGAGAVIAQNIPANCTAVSQKARIILKE